MLADQLVPAHAIVREALGGLEPHNTNTSEMALRELGFPIVVTRRYDKRTGEPVTLTIEQRNESED